jgi:hypothetical protein
VYQGLVAAIGAEAQSVMAVLQDAIRRGPDGHHPEIQLAFAGLVQPNDVGSQVGKLWWTQRLRLGSYFV